MTAPVDDPFHPAPAPPLADPPVPPDPNGPQPFYFLYLVGPDEETVEVQHYLDGPVTVAGYDDLGHPRPIGEVTPVDSNTVRVTVVPGTVAQLRVTAATQEESAAKSGRASARR